MKLVNYLIGQLRLSQPARVDALREFAPSALDSDWELTTAGQRVQVIRRDKRKGGVLEFDTTVLGAADGSIAGLLGALAGGLDRGTGDARRTAALLSRPISGLAAYAQRHGSVAGGRIIRRAGAVRGGVVMGHQGAGDCTTTTAGGVMTVALHRAWAKDLDVPTLYALLKLRVEVFVVEQACPYPELDGRDLLAETRHFWLEAPDGEVICTLRLMEEHAGGQKAFRLGRLCTKRSARGQGHTTRLLRAALAEVGDYPCRINAQIYLADMYAQHGFVRDGDDFLDDGVPHVPMLRARLRSRREQP